MARSGDVVERARSLVPMLEENRSFAETNARLAPAVVTSLRDAGMFGLAAPVEVGGEEATLVEIFDVTEVVASADPSASWYVLNSATGSRAAAWLDASFWPDVYHPPLRNFGLSAAPAGRLQERDGGYSLSGTWPLMTGVLDAEWALVFCRLRQGDERPALRQAVVRTADLHVDEVWQDAVAMRGTGSHVVAAADMFVPVGLVVDPSAPARLDRPLFRCSGYAIAGAYNSAVPIGVLRAAVGSAGAELKDKVSTVFGGSAASNTALQELMAEALAGLELLHFGVKGALDASWAYYMEGVAPPVELRATVAASPYQAVGIARDLISRLYARSSRQAFFVGHPLERALRDIHAIAYGLDVLRPFQHDAGRVAMGLDPVLPGF